MKKHLFFTLICLILSNIVNGQITKLTDYSNKSSAPIGTFQGISFREGGFSGLYPIEGTGGKEFWTVGDRGVNVDAGSSTNSGAVGAPCAPTYDKIYAFPDFAPKIYRIRVKGDSVQILRAITIKRPNNTNVTGIMNPTGLGSTALEVASTDTVSNCADFAAKQTPKDTFGIDAEGIVVDKQGNFWLCEEGGPTVWKLNPNGKVIARYTPYANKPGAQSIDIAIDTVFGYRKNNRGFEGITITPNGKIYAIIQSPILYPTLTVGEATRIHRILEIDPTTNAQRMLVYVNDSIIGASGGNQIRLRDWKIGDLAAVNDSVFLVLEAAARGTSDIKRMYQINIAQATEVNSGLYGAVTLEGLVGYSGLAANSIKPVTKTLVMDLLANGWPAALDKAEGLAIVNDSTIFIGNDNDFGANSTPNNGLVTASGNTCHVIEYKLAGANKLQNFTPVKMNLMQGKTGLNSSQAPYVLPTTPNSNFTSIISVGDSAMNGYRMVGIPDGAGAFDNNDGTFTMLVAHELGSTVGIVRKHGNIGAFISKWIINKSDLSVVSGSDLIRKLNLWNGTAFVQYDSASPAPAAIGRFCSADLAPKSAFYNAATGLGSQERVFLSGEETGAEGRVFAHILTGPNAGTSYQLPYLGKYSWENAMASPFSGDSTIVIGTDDATPGQVYVYIGAKKNTGTEIEKAGLQNGLKYGVKVVGLALEVSPTMIAPNTRFSLEPLGDVSAISGLSLDTMSTNRGVTRFLRPEDGAWDPNVPNDFYFVTTNGFTTPNTTPSRMYRLRFDDIKNPSLGGRITAVLDGMEGPRMMDNMCVDNRGRSFIQEDPGNNAHIAKIWQYTNITDSLKLIGMHDSTRFIIGSANYLTQDEEASGIIDAQEFLGAGTYLLVDQIHKSLGGELVEEGQILVYKTADTAISLVKVQVSGNSIQIPNKDVTPIAADNTNFGTIDKTTNVTKSFLIENKGTVALTVDSIKLNGASAFALVGVTTPFSVGANSNYTLQVQMTAADAIVYNSTVLVYTNDPNAEMFKYDVTGNGFCAKTITPMTVAGSKSFCEGDSVTLTCPTGSSYIWSTGAGSQSIKQKVSGAISATYQDNFTCPRKTDTLTVTAFTVPSIPTITLVGNIFTCNSDNVSYQWFNGANLISGATAKTFSATTTGSYSVSAANLNLALCAKKSAETTYTIVAPPSSILNSGDISILMYPNPVVDIINIQTEESFEYSILNTLGLKISSGKISKGGNQIKLDEKFSKGTYFIQFTNNLNAYIQSFIKE